ncbi:MAG: hypothetical protein BGO86_15470 [Chryseobacterium sp. 36-9]|uniref:Por secretion system C-terminal sorting domain-containing protein n=1 Tax=Epilithonimonas pallida TaxID=373671 RepID=A0ABY1QY56_9FLAO|nr:hypothetical protein [Epilithonimonas pallida]OJX33560.1 MAG: hypothetical protein BGO86_15470 [Chryseobacterium sp. 36-9]SMP88685.1 hypothetical protein SAMN05421679_101535 [Epilithonimonas pallida]
MKSLLKISLIVSAMLISMSVSAKDKFFSISLTEANSKTLRFEIFNAENVSLYFYNDRKDEIYSENIGNKENVEKTYDLSTLSEGDYFLVAESDFKIEKYKVTIDKNGNVSAAKTPVLAFNKPEYTVENNIVKLHMNSIENAINVTVSDLANNEYYNQSVKANNGEINLKFDLNANNSPAYIISVEKNGDVFNRLITLK